MANVSVGKSAGSLTKAARQAALQAAVPHRPDAELVSECDPQGETVSHARIVDPVSRLIRAGMMEPQYGTAVTRFRRDFRAACYEPLSAMDLRRVRGAGGYEEIRDSVEDARERVWAAMNHLGGMSSPTGSILWHVVGMEMSLRDWTLRQVWGAGRTIRQEVATGIFLGAVAALNACYFESRSARRGQGKR